jgi:hypothetical protein
MQESHNAFISKQFLKSIWDHEYEAFKGSREEEELIERLQQWSKRADLGETSSEAAFLDTFFVKTWGYDFSNVSRDDDTFTLHPQFPVTALDGEKVFGTADAALGYFEKNPVRGIPQVLCEFKDIGTSQKSKKSQKTTESLALLDIPKTRKGKRLTPVEQGLEYLSASRRGMFGNEPLLPMWALVTDMNEFRLYWHDRGARQYLQFNIEKRDLFGGPSMLSEDEEARFERFLFAKVFHRDSLIVKGKSGRPLLYQLVQQQRFRQRKLENTFYEEYRAYREYLYRVLLQYNDEQTGRFPGTRGRLVRLAQKLLIAVFLYSFAKIWAAF